MIDRVTGQFATTESRLALEVRSQFFGFAVVQADMIVDWGTCGFPGHSESRTTAINRLAAILKLHGPSIVISRPPRATCHRSSKIAAGVLNAIRKELERLSITFKILSRSELDQFFLRHGVNNKWDRAALVADGFDVLKSKLPRPRKKWEPEPRVLAIFDAAATAIAFGYISADALSV